MTIKEELKEYLKKADPKDLRYCLREHFEKDSVDENYFKTISTLYWNDKKAFDTLSAGCKASILIYLAIR